MILSLPVVAFLALAIQPASAENSLREQAARAPARPSIGVASFIARTLDGRKTASGEIFNSRELVAAHRTYPLGTRLRVTNLANGREVVVRVIDRMGRPRRRGGPVLDVSRAAAARLGFLQQGTTRVRMEVLGARDRADVRER
jgi:rare lipoprotein A